MSDLNKDIERCKELIKTEHSNWIGMSNQDAISNVLSDREFLQDKVNWYSKEYDKLFDENNKLSKETETSKKIAEKLAEYGVNCGYGIPLKFKDTDELMAIVREEVENEINKARYKNT